MQLIDQVRRFSREHDLVRPDTRVIAAVSGGSDSVALAHLVGELAAAGEVRLAGLVHFNHQLRATADRDAQAASEVADALGRPIVVDRGDVAARARRERRSLEDAARAARYECFERARAKWGADLVALGHTRDDQAETFLLRLLRGAGPRGLAAMYPRRGAFIRPLLACRRAALRAYLEERQIRFVDDESNADVGIPRNRIRAELVPLLTDRFNPSIVDVLADQAALARDEWTWMAAAADELLARAAGALGRTSPTDRVTGDVKGDDARSLVEALECELDVTTLSSAPRALQRLAVWRAMNAVAAGRPVGFEHVQAALDLLGPSAASVGIDGPGQRVQRLGSRLVLTRKGSRGCRGSRANPFCYPLSIPGEVRMAEARWVVSAETRPAGSEMDEPEPEAGGAVAIVRSDVCRGPLAVRNRRPGDWFRPVGLAGRKKLQDFFVDRKVARHERDRVLLVVDEQDRIVWVAGYAIDAQFRITDATQSMLILRLREARPAGV